MLKGDDQGTVHAVRELERVVRSQEKPLVFWIGAGASRWCGFPLWSELADQLHSLFLRQCGAYNKERGAEFIKEKDFPKFFSLARSADEGLFFRSIEGSLKAQPISAVYRRFAEALSGFDPKFIITTNFDGLLQATLGPMDTIEGDEIERAIAHIGAKKSFVCHIHGCADRLKSLVLTEEDYAQKIGDQRYQESLRQIFSQSTVLFLGYGLGDQYILDGLGRSGQLSGILGSGPHFVVSSMENPSLPTCIRQIRYHSNYHADHRSAIFALEAIRSPKNPSQIGVFLNGTESAFGEVSTKSIYYLAGVYPPGRHTSSQTITAAAVDGQKGIEFTIGLGFTNEELSDATSTGLHDLVTGLLCFDTIAFPLGSIASVHGILGADLFWRVVSESCFKFVWKKSDRSIIFPSGESLTDGAVGGITHSKPGEGTPKIDRILREIILRGTLGEADYNQRMELLQRFVIDEPSSDPTAENLVRGVLLHQHVQRAIGMSDGIMPSKIPRWLTYPVLRVAHVVDTGITTQAYGMAATSIPFGGNILAGPIFSGISSGDWTQQAANYVIAGEITARLAISPSQVDGLVTGILRYRDTESGIQFRKTILECLSVKAGAEFSSAINAGLHRAIPMDALSKARSGIKAYIPEVSGGSNILTAVVGGEGKTTDLGLWRNRSLGILRKICSERGIKSYDPCPCGSGEKLRFCCEAALTKTTF